MLLHKSVWVLQTAEGEPETKSCYAVAHVSVGFTDCRRRARNKELLCCCTRQCGFYRLQKESQKQRVVMLLHTSEWVLQTADGEPETKSFHAVVHVSVGFTDCTRGARNKELSCCCTRQCGFYRLQTGSQKQRVGMLLHRSASDFNNCRRKTLSN